MNFKTEEPTEEPTEDTVVQLWDVLESITSKKNWYSKVFDPIICQKWQTELNQDLVFTQAIQILQATAQGTEHRMDCDWDQEQMCQMCEDTLRADFLIDPTKFGYEADEKIDDYNVSDIIFELEYYCNHPICSCLAPHHELTDYIIYRKDLVAEPLHQALNQCVNEMMAILPPDWHPGSNQQVLDIIHPSMYPYIKGLSVLKDGTVEELTPENLRYQWLPSVFNITATNQATLKSYINNHQPERFPTFIPLIEQLLASFIPSFEKVIKASLRNTDLQVIVKVGSTQLREGSSVFHGGSWHIEGMAHEHIIATGLHYLKVDGITDSFLQFRKPVIVNEDNCDYPQSNGRYTTHHYGIEPGSHHDGYMNRYLGLIKADEEYSVVFPNTLQHQVKEFSLRPDKQFGIRTIIAFFLIDPKHKLISTADVPPQQELFTVEEANHHRDRLMVQRKYFVNHLNEIVYERPINLCEH